MTDDHPREWNSISMTNTMNGLKDEIEEHLRESFDDYKNEQYVCETKGMLIEDIFYNTKLLRRINPASPLAKEIKEYFKQEAEADKARTEAYVEEIKREKEEKATQAIRAINSGFVNSLVELQVHAPLMYSMVEADIQRLGAELQLEFTGSISNNSIASQIKGKFIRLVDRILQEKIKCFYRPSRLEVKLNGDTICIIEP